MNSTDSHFLTQTGTTVDPSPATVTEPIFGAYLVNLGKQGVDAQVYVSLDGGYMIFTEVESKAETTLNKVYRAEAITQKEVTHKVGYSQVQVPIIFGHSNKAMGADEIKEEFLSRARFQRIK